MVEDFLYEWKDGFGDRVVIDDDGRVCYAYLFVGEKCEGDVWLYNVAAAPEIPEWTLPGREKYMPFLNPSSFCVDTEFEPLRDPADAIVVWGMLEGRRQAAIHLRGRYHALLTENERPGWCRLARLDGPVAKVLKTSA